MNIDWVSIAKKAIPLRLQPFAYSCWRKLVGPKLERKIKEYYEHHSVNEEIKEALAFLGNGDLPAFPYPWAYEGKPDGIRVFVDEEKGLPYALMGDKRLYFPVSWKEREIRNYFHGIENIEQHPQSPHRYLTDDFSVTEEDVVVDGGAAEGNFGLHVVDHVKKLYIFEPEEQWQAPLQATFAPWKDKVFVVPKFISRQCDDMTVTLDSYFADKEKPTFLKLDVEGFESNVLDGAHEILSRSIRRAVICTYHRAGDEENLSQLMREHKFSVNPSYGYMLFKLFEHAQPPYFRRGLIRCEKR